MPVFEIKTPDGKTLRVTAPEGATKEEALARVQAQYRAQESAPSEVTPEERNRIGREELGNPLQAGLVGVGRFATEVGQGLKQKALMAGEGMGLVDEGRAQEYTDEIMGERQRWDELTEGAGAEDVGYYGAMLAPGLLAPGAGIAGTAALGALETGVLPTEEASWGEAGKQAATGAAFAGGARALPDAYRAYRGARNKRALNRLDPDAVALSERGVKMSPDMYAPSTARSVGRAAVDLPVVSDRLRGQPMREDAERVMRELVEENPSERNIQQAFIEGKEGLKKAEGDLWESTMRQIGDAPVSNAMVGQRFHGLMRQMEDNASFGPDTVAEVRKLWSERPKRWMSLEDLHNFRKRFAADQQGRFAEQGLNAAAPKMVYKMLTEEIETAAKRSYGDEGLNLFQSAVDESRNLNRTLRSARVLKSAAADQLDSNSTFVRAALGNDKDKRTAMRQILGESGAPAVRNEIATDILETYLNKGPKAAQRRIAGLDSSIKDFFGPDEAAVYRGLGKFLDNLPSTGMGQFTSGIVSGGVGTALGVGSGGVAVPAAVLGAVSTALRRRDVQAMLQKLSKEPSDSKLAQELSKHVGLVLAGESAQPEPLRVPIQEGRPQ